MSDQTITCPNCKTEIKLTESLAAPLLEATPGYRRLVRDVTSSSRRYGRPTWQSQDSSLIEREIFHLDDFVQQMLALDLAMFFP
jgi:hypothetical protein